MLRPLRHHAKATQAHAKATQAHAKATQAHRSSQLGSVGWNASLQLHAKGQDATPTCRGTSVLMVALPVLCKWALSSLKGPKH
jgi:hypothetical protein